MKKYKFLLLLLLNMFICGIHPVYAELENPSTEQCFINKVFNKQIGYSCTSQKVVTKNNVKKLLTNEYSELTFKRLGYVVKMVQDTSYTEDELGNPLYFESRIQNMGEQINIKGNFITPNKVTVTTTINGVEDIKEFTSERKVLFPSSIEKLFAGNNEKIEYTTIYPGQDFRIINVEAQKLNTENVNTGIGSLVCAKYKVNTDLLPNVDDYEWHNSDGKLCKEFSSILNMEKNAVNRTAINNTIETVDLLKQVLVPVSQSIPDPNLLDQVFYKVESKYNIQKPMFLSNERQKILQIKDSSLYLKVKNERTLDYYKYPVSAKGLTEYLKSGPYITSNDPVIKKQAEILVGHDSNAYVIAKGMERWVNSYITKKDYNVDFANSSQVYASREGDCTEHSVLLASVLRAAGIPSKIVVGLLYSPENQGFLYHMWVKAYIGKWINLDASIPQSQTFSPLHIEIAENALDNPDDKTALTLNIIKTLSKIKINVINFTKITSAVTDVKIPPVQEKVGNERFNFVSLLKNSENLTRKPSAKNNSNNDQDDSPILEVKNSSKTVEDFWSSAYYDFSRGDISKTQDDFMKAAKTIQYNDDFSTRKLAVELANLGFFNMSADLLRNIQNRDIWTLQLDNIKRTYFPLNEISPSQELYLANLTSMVKYIKNNDAAIAFAKKNKSKIGNIDYTHFILAKAYQAKGDKNNAFKEYTRALTLNPSNLNYRLDLAKYCNQLGLYEKAEKEAGIIINLNPPDKNIINLALNEYYFAKSKLSKSDKTKSGYYLAKYYQQKSQNQAAIDILNKTIKEKRENPEVYRLLGDIYYDLGNLDMSKKNYNIALNKNSKNKQALFGLGNIYKKLGNYKTALVYYNKSLKYGISPELYGSIADCYKMLSINKEAFAFYVKAVKMDTNNFNAYYNLGLLYINYKDTEKAKTFLKYAASIDPSQPGPWTQLSKLEVESGNYVLAKNYLDRLNILNPRSPELYYYLGLINKNNNNLEEAKSNFQRAIDLNPDYSDALDQFRLL